MSETFRPMVIAIIEINTSAVCPSYEDKIPTTEITTNKKITKLIRFVIHTEDKASRGSLMSYVNLQQVF